MAQSVLLWIWEFSLSAWEPAAFGTIMFTFCTFADFPKGLIHNWLRKLLTHWVCCCASLQNVHKHACTDVVGKNLQKEHICLLTLVYWIVIEIFLFLVEWLQEIEEQIYLISFHIGQFISFLTYAKGGDKRKHWSAFLFLVAYF